MDAATRAELDALRLRAFGPAADIDDDRTAVARLIELEETLILERSAPMEAEPLGSTHAERIEPVDVEAVASIRTGPADADDGMPAEHRPAPGTEDVAETDARPSESGSLRDDPQTGRSQVDPDASTRRSRRGGLILGSVALVAVVAITAVVTQRLTDAADVEPGEAAPTAVHIEAREAYSLARDPESTVILRIPLQGSLPTTGDFPRFLSSGRIEWAAPLGEYFGWNLWIAGADGALQPEHCILLERDDQTRSRCVVATLRSQSALLVSVPYALVEAGELPDDLQDGERLGFWWSKDSEITVLLGRELGT